MFQFNPLVPVVYLPNQYLIIEIINRQIGMKQVGLIEKIMFLETIETLF